MVPSEMSPFADDPAFADVYDEDLRRPDGRVVAWTRSGAARDSSGAGIPVLRMPGTPGSRWALRADRRDWAARNVEMITTERPGFGRSTRLPGRGFAEHADDVAAVLDHLGLDRVRVFGTSGGGPHVLAFAGRHPDRVVAATIVVGMPRLSDDEAEQMIDFNRASYRVARAGDPAALRELLSAPGQAMRDDPLGTLAALTAQAPASDHAVMTDPDWQKATAAGIQEAFRQGVDGWVDEGMALYNSWADIELSAIRASLTWWHGRADKNCPWSAAARLVEDLPTAVLRDLGEAGHLAPFLRDTEILDELLNRG